MVYNGISYLFSNQFDRAGINGLCICGIFDNQKTNAVLQLHVWIVTMQEYIFYVYHFI